MAFRKNGWTSWAAGIATAFAVRTADAQIYSQLPAQTAPAGNQQPAYPQYPNQQAPGRAINSPRTWCRRDGMPQYQGQQYPRSQSPQYQAPPSTRFQSPQGQYGAAVAMRARRNQSGDAISASTRRIRNTRTRRARIRSIKRREFVSAQPNGYQSEPRTAMAQPALSRTWPRRGMQQARV